MAENLTPQQMQAVNYRGGRLLVSAAAGSGKTKVLVDRLLSYILDPVAPANVDDFLIITYTKAAASELRGKIADKLSERISQAPENRHLQRQMQRLYLAKISTVHAYCADILRENAHLLDISGNFRVAEESECLELQMKAAEDVLNNAYMSVDRDEAFRAFIETLGVGRNDARVPQLIFDMYKRAMCHLDPEKWLDDCMEHYALQGVSDMSQTAWGAYMMEDAKTYLRLQIESFSQCADAARNVSGFEKVAGLLDDTVDQLMRLERCAGWDQFVSHMDIDFGTLSFPRKCPDPELAAGIKAVRNACKKGLEKYLRRFSAMSLQGLKELQASRTVITGMLNLVKEFAKQYATLKAGRNILDFTDLEQKALDLLLGKKHSGVTSIALENGERFREVMVDEYQDSNAVQDAIYSALTAKRQNCFMVGDVKQSIYQFRLADPTIFLEKYNGFPCVGDAALGQGKKVLLSSNFRSSGGVIDAVNDVFSLCMSPKVGGLYYSNEECLNEGIPHSPLGEPEVELFGIDVQEDTYLEEANFVSQRIRTLLTSGAKVREGDTLRAVRPNDIVILLRSPGSVGVDFQNALERQGIRCSVGNQIDLLQTEEVQVLLSILQIVSNPLQDIPLISAVTSRIFCFTADDVARIRCAQRSGSFYDAIKKCEDEKSCVFFEILDDLRQFARISTLPKLLERLFLVTNIDNIYGALQDGKVRTENLQMFYQYVCDYASTGQGNLDAFLNHIVTLQQSGLRLPEEDASDDSVRIMSIHKSKGLEFPVVILAGLSKDFNQEDTRGQVLCDRVLGIGINNTDAETRVRYPTIAKNAIARKMIVDGVSEELRVLYVAMTRARDRLIMTYASRKVQEYLENIKMRLSLSSPELIAMDTVCAGDWVLMTALSGSASKGHKTLYPWKVKIVRGSTEEQQSCDLIAPMLERSTIPVDKIRDSLGFVYPHRAATTAPSKQTATQLKGRAKDHEASEYAKTSAAHYFNWRTPSFVNKAEQQTEVGKTIHSVMQHIRFHACADLAGVQSEIQRLSEEGFIPDSMLSHIDAEGIYAFFETDIGRLLIEASRVLREFKFSILVDGNTYYDELADEKILLQGVVDCALIQDDGITVIDFKTDTVTESTLDRRALLYSDQVRTYACALEKIFKLPVKEKLLYFFKPRKIVKVD